MLEILSGLPMPAWLVAGLALGAWLAKPVGEMVRVLTGRQSAVETARADRIVDLEDLIDLMRKALDKGRIRESALASVADVLIFAIDHVADPPPALTQLRARALAVLQDARAQIETINQETRA